MSHLYAEVTSKDIGEESHLQALKVMAWCCRELKCAAGPESLKWFVGEELSNGKRSDAWDQFEHVSEFTSEDRIVGLCKSRDEIWVHAGLGTEQQHETVIHEMCHMSIKRTRGSAGETEEELVEKHTQGLMRAFSQEQAEADFIEWLVDPARWEIEALGSVKAHEAMRRVSGRW